MLLESLEIAMSLVNREAPAEVMASSVLPLMASATGATTAALYCVGADDRAEVLAVFGPTSRRTYPYTPVDLSDAALGMLGASPDLVLLRASETSCLPKPILEVCARRPSWLVMAPAFAGHTLGGVVVLSGKREPEPQDETSRFIRVLADGIGLSLGYGAVSRSSEQSEAVLQSACAVARAISGSLDLEHTYAQIVRSAARVMGNCHCLLLELSDQTGELVAVADSDPDRRSLLGLQVRFEDDPSPRAALEKGRTIVVDDVVWGMGLGPEVREHLSFRSAMFVPIHAERGLIGSLLLYTAERREAYSGHDVARAVAIAEQAASAICNAQVFRELTSSKEQTAALLRRITRLRQEKGRDIARVVHDDIVQTVVAAHYEVEGLRERVAPTMKSDVDRVERLLRQAIDDARSLIWELRPPALEGLGLVGALQSLVDRLTGEVRVVLRVAPAGLPPIENHVESALYIIAREALSNAVRHAHAAHISLSLASTGDPEPNLRLLVSDDGLGFDSSETGEKQDHFGLTMMEEQAAAVGGRLTIVSKVGVGTTVDVTVPLPTAVPVAS